MYRIDPQDIEIVRSAQRSKTVTGEFKHGKLRVHVPAHLNKSEEAYYVAKVRKRVELRETKQLLNAGDPLLKRAAELNAEYFAGKLEIVSAQYVTNQNSLFGSCSVRRKTIAFLTTWQTCRHGYATMCSCMRWPISSSRDTAEHSGTLSTATPARRRPGAT